MHLLWILLFSTWSAWANILFLDMNNSPKEIEAAAEAAKNSKRELVVYPVVPQKVRSEITALDGKINKLMRTRDKKCKKMDSDFCKKTADEIGAKLKQREEMAKPYKFSKEGLLSFLEEQKKSGKTFPSVVVSGHDGTGSFSGHFGRVGDEELAKIFAQANIHQDVRTFHLWGCYTTSPGSLMLNWKKHFPNISLFTGYDGRAPLNDKPAGWSYLKGVLEKEPALLEVENAKKLQAILKKIPGANQVTSAIYSCDDYASLTEAYNFQDMGEKCEKFKEQLLADEDTYQCYLKSSREECFDPPANTGRSPLRDYYELTQKAVACRSFSEDPIFRNLSRDQAIRLIFFREVVNNFSRIYEKEIRESNEILKSLGAPSDVLLENPEKLTRKELLEKMEKLLAFLQSQSFDLALQAKPGEFGEREAKLYALRNFHRGLTSTLMDLSSGCVPFNWTEPHKDDLSQCMNPNFLGSKGAQYALEKKSSVGFAFFDEVKREIGKGVRKKEEVEALSDTEKALHFYNDALVSRLSTYQYNGQREDADSKALLDLADRQLAWATLAKEIVTGGGSFNDPRLQKMLMEYNQKNSERNLSVVEARLKGFQENQKANGENNDPQSLDAAAKEKLKKHLAELEADVSRESLALELQTALLEQGKDYLQTKRAEQILLEVGDLLAEKEISVLETRYTYTTKGLQDLEKAGNTKPEELQALKAEKEKFSRRIEELKSNKNGSRLELARKYLLQPRFMN